MIIIPKKAFEMQGQDGSSVVPQDGDTVPLDGLTGKVVKSDDVNVYVEPVEFNGEPVTPDPEETAEDKSGAAPDEGQQKKDLLSLLSQETGQ